MKILRSKEAASLFTRCSDAVKNALFRSFNASVKLRLGLQCRYKTFCLVRLCNQVSNELSDLLLFVSYFASQSRLKKENLAITF